MNNTQRRALTETVDKFNRSVHHPLPVGNLKKQSHVIYIHMTESESVVEL